MDNYKIKVKDEAESKEAQGLFKQLGYELDSFFGNHEANTKWVLACTDGSMGCASDGMAKDTLKEITFPQLRDLVAAKNKTVREFLEPQEDGTYKLIEWSCLTCPPEDYVEVPEGADCLMQWPTGHKVFYRDNFAKSWNSAYREWQFVSGDDGIDQSSTLWKRATQDPALISGAEALADITNIQHAYDDREVWYTTQYSTLTIPEILKGETSDGRKINFRLKPPTISVNAELPKPSRELQQNTEVYAVTYEFKTREDRNAFADKLRGTNS